MTQSAAAPPPPAAQQAPAPADAQKSQRFWPAPTGKPVRAGIQDTPSLLNRLQIIGMAAVLLFGLASGLVQFLSYQSDGRAADDTEQLVRVQDIQSSLLSADALATNVFLVGGGGDPDREAAFRAAIEDVLKQIAAAADAQPADKNALEALVVEINDYTTSVAAAQVYNRQQFPVGAEYLSGASASLRLDALPILNNLVDANTDRAQDSLAGQHPFYLLLIGLLALGVLVWMSMVLARRFRRYVNVGVAVAAAIVLVTTLVASIAAWRGDNQNDDLHDHELQAAVDQAAARTAGNDAKALESLRLIKRGSGSTVEPQWEADAKVVEDNATGSALDSWNAYADGHRQIVAYDDKDLWFKARGIAIDRADNKPTAFFDAFDATTQKLAEKNGKTTSDELRAGRTVALLGSLLTLLLGLVSSVAVARGISARRKEYA
ncbi:hypothetical protein F0U44_08845 [Nocardioides humilatus]|uniref:Secreted protein n=1 Tax=Nocardioides humilatus TaxID=2607660 RepID=A0A5B1LEG5_9ACTN|nr:hypothetical protein [Nocardioides humilatus]KAA1418598.1 hypothetical protein F0U44_08845 [Nocardioides humilatus]